MATIGPDGTFDDGTNFTQSGTGTSVGGNPNDQDLWSTTGVYGNSPRYIPGSGWWSPSDGWVGGVNDGADAPGVARAYRVAGEQKAAGGINANPNHADDPGDVKYYDQTSKNPLYGSGPVIDQTASGESRNLSMDALGMLRDRATGGVTPAQTLQAAQTAGAVNAVQSGAASIKGGAQARAAASMGAAGTAQRVQASGNADQAALAAREQADAQTQYFGDSSAQRGRDLGLATSQAQLDAGQRTANEQHEETYQNLKFGQQSGMVQDKLGLSAEQQAAMNASRQTTLNENATATQNAKTVGSAVVGGVNGAATAFGNTQQPTQTNSSDDPWDPKNYSGSDPEMKTNVKPVDDKTARALALIADGMKNGLDANLKNGPSAGGSARDRIQARAQEVAKPEYDGKYLPVPKPTLDEAITAQAMKDRADIAAQPMYGYFGEDDAPKHPAGGWSLGEGYSEDPGHNYSSATRHVRPENEWAPGAADFYAGSHSKDLMTSDPKAKREAFVAGMSHANEASDTGHFGQLPDYMQQGVPRQQPAAPVRKAAATESAPRQDKTAQRVENIRAQTGYDINDAMHDGGIIFGPGAYLGAGVSNAMDDAHQASRSAMGPRASFPERAVQSASDQMTRAFPDRQGFDPYAAPERDTTTSDPETKTHFGNSPMAEANRSMDAKSYEYKPEYLPGEQHQGEVNVGPMADKMKADPVASTAIVTDPKSGLLAIDKTKGLKLVMGGLAALQRQVDGMRGGR